MRRRPPGRRLPRRRVVAAGVVAVAAAVVPLIVVQPWASSGGTGGADLARWNAQAAQAFTPVAQRVPVMSRYLQQWEAGGLSSDGLEVQVQQTARMLDGAEAAADRLPPYPGAPAVDVMYRAAARLYVLADQVMAAAAGLAPGALRDQVVRISERIQELGDRTFDQGRVLTAGGLTPPGLPAGTTVKLPAEVPDWTAEGLAAGPPLAPPPPPAAAFPPLRQGPRPTEPRNDWVRTVTRLGVAEPVDLSDAAGLGPRAAALEQEAAAVAALADPRVTHGREASDRLRLSLLVRAEACRTAQAAGQLPQAAVGEQLRRAATALLAAAGSISVPSLP